MSRKTKIICTVGPAIDSEEMLIKMFNAGMNVARLNFSHGTHASAVKKIARIRAAAAKVNKHIAIMLDTKGPEIRTGCFENGAVEYNIGDCVSLVKEEVLGNKNKIQILCSELFDDVEVGNVLLVDDGKISLKIVAVNQDEIIVEFLNSGKISDHKGINAPGVNLTMPFISQTDLDDIKFGCEQGVDLIALSFVRTADDVLEVKKLLEEFGKPNIEVIAKIESKQGIENLDEILKVADGIMVARGDLGVEVQPELVPLYQKKMIKMANEVGKPVITATHMLESMIENPRPTRAEASDVANAILDGSDAIMLSGESAVGKYPLQSVGYMDKIANIAESMLDPVATIEAGLLKKGISQSDAIGISAAQLCLTQKNIKAIFAFTETGGTARRLCKYRPCVPVIACTNSPEVCRKLAYYWGIQSVITNFANDFNMCDSITQIVAESLGYKQGDKVIIVSGFGSKHGITNTLRIIEIED